VLVDCRLRELGIEPARIRGYEREVSTHFSVAADVASGVADVGVGILAAARALKLDFIPIAKERYDLVIPRDHYTSDLLGPLLSALRSDDFRERVDDLGGYDTADLGRVMAEIE
jgi:putative molybdopterin biosynthesis protein